MTKNTTHLAMFTAVGGSLLVAIGLFVPARTVAQGTQQAPNRAPGCSKVARHSPIGAPTGRACAGTSGLRT
jgi:hypothetical protein